MKKKAKTRTPMGKRRIKTAAASTTGRSTPANVDVLRFAVAPSQLGSSQLKSSEPGLRKLDVLLVAASKKGVVAILLGEDPISVVEQLHGLFPKSDLVAGGGVEDAIVEQITAHIADPTRPLDFPLDLRGTEFQRRVWRAVARIPLGRTMTYAEVAKKIGAPRAMRAVGNACANCHVYFAVPCHRVVPSGSANDRSATGGRARPGADRRAELLRRETAGR